MDDRDILTMNRLPSITRPLLGLTILAVEDSLYSCEAMRLMCQRSGARLRRADCLRSARRHLQVYRPSVVIIDMGLPDGSGAELIDDLHHARPRVGVILATSGDPMAASVARAAGADGFLEKPLASLGAFQAEILAHLPADRQPMGPRLIRDDRVCPDRLAYHDDIAHAAEVLSDDPADGNLGYALQFLAAVAQSAEDVPLLAAAQDVAQGQAQGLPLRAGIARLVGMVQERLEQRVAI